MLTPATLSLVTSLFAEGAARNRAIGIWGAAGSSRMVLGSILGGVLTQSLGWESVFFVNIPLTLVGIVLGMYVIPQDPKRDKNRNFDLFEALTVTLGISFLVYSLVIGPDIGWLSIHALIFFSASVLLLISFTIIELRSSDPLIPMYLFKNRNLSTGTIITFCFMASFGALAYFLTIYLQQVRKLDAFTTGMAFVLPCVSILLGTIIGAKLATKLGLRSTLISGLSVGTIGTGIFAVLLTSSVSWWVLAPCVVVFSLAQGIVFTAMFATATSGVSADKQGIASGIAASGQQIGAAVGLAVLVALSNSHNSGTNTDNILIVTDGLSAAFFSAAIIMMITLVITFGLKRLPPLISHS